MATKYTKTGTKGVTKGLPQVPTGLSRNAQLAIRQIIDAIAELQIKASDGTGQGSVEYNTYNTVTGIEEAPADGKTYGRRDGSWVEITSAPAVLPNSTTQTWAVGDAGIGG